MVKEQAQHQHKEHTSVEDIDTQASKTNHVPEKIISKYSLPIDLYLKQRK